MSDDMKRELREDIVAGAVLAILIVLVVVFGPRVEPSFIYRAF